MGLITGRPVLVVVLIDLVVVIVFLPMFVLRAKENCLKPVFVCPLLQHPVRVAVVERVILMTKMVMVMMMVVWW